MRATSIICLTLLISSFCVVECGLPRSIHRTKQHILNKRQDTKQVIANSKSAPRSLACDRSTCFYSGVQIHIAEGEGLSACRDCNDPATEGIYRESSTCRRKTYLQSPFRYPLYNCAVDTWECAYRPRNFAVTAGMYLHATSSTTTPYITFPSNAELIFGVPNDGHVPYINNVKGFAVLVDRGNVSFAQKAKNGIQAGAVAIVIRDDGSCGEDFECGARLGSKSAHYLAAKDDKLAWEGVNIPVVMVSKAGGDRLAALMKLHSVTIDGMGTQYYAAG